MATLDTTLRQTAVDLLSELGKTVTVRRKTGGSYDAATGSVTGGSTETQSVKATPPEKFRADLVDGTLILESDVQVSVAAQGLTFVPAVGHEVQLDAGGDWREVVRVDAVYSGELVALYTLQVRG